MLISWIHSLVFCPYPPWSLLYLKRIRILESYHHWPEIWSSWRHSFASYTSMNAIKSATPCLAPLTLIVSIWDFYRNYFWAWNESVSASGLRAASAQWQWDFGFQESFQLSETLDVPGNGSWRETNAIHNGGLSSHTLRLSILKLKITRIQFVTFSTLTPSRRRPESQQVLHALERGPWWELRNPLQALSICNDGLGCRIRTCGH